MKKLVLKFITFNSFLILSFPIYSNPDVWTESYRLEVAEQYGAAAKILDPILEQNPQHEFAQLRHAWLNYLSASYSSAIKDYQKALKINDKSLEAQLGIVLPLLAQKRWREAAKYANQVLTIAPWNYYAHVRLMICEEAQGQWEKLRDHALQVHLRYAADATVLVYLARSYDRLGDKNAAKATYEKVLQRIPEHQESITYLRKP